MWCDKEKVRGPGPCPLHSLPQADRRGVAKGRAEGGVGAATLLSSSYIAIPREGEGRGLGLHGRPCSGCNYRPALSWGHRRLGELSEARRSPGAGEGRSLLGTAAGAAVGSAGGQRPGRGRLEVPALRPHAGGNKRRRRRNRRGRTVGRAVVVIGESQACLFACCLDVARCYWPVTTRAGAAACSLLSLAQHRMPQPGQEPRGGKKEGRRIRFIQQQHLSSATIGSAPSPLHSATPSVCLVWHLPQQQDGGSPC